MTHLFIQKWIVQFPSIYVGSEFLLVLIYVFIILWSDRIQRMTSLFAKPCFAAYTVIDFEAGSMCY